MELHELGAEYLRRSEILTNRIHELNGYLNGLDGNDRLKLKHRISALYTDAAECKRLALILLNYRREQPNEQNKIQP